MAIAEAACVSVHGATGSAPTRCSTLWCSAEPQATVPPNSSQLVRTARAAQGRGRKNARFDARPAKVPLQAELRLELQRHAGTLRRIPDEELMRRGATD